MKPKPLNKIPLSLAIVSYVFFTFGLIVTLAGGAGVASTTNNSMIRSIILVILGISFFYVSRGLRRCSRGWRIFALIVMSYVLSSTVYGTVYYFVHYPILAAGAYPFVFLVGRIIVFLMEISILRVLTRADIRCLFYTSQDAAEANQQR
jgi:hypothetical protein